MIFSQFKRVLKEDLSQAGGEMPKWIDTLIAPINLFIEQVALALQNRLNFQDNFYSKTVTLKFQSGVPIEINPTTPFAKSARALGVLTLSSSGENVDSMVWDEKANGNIEVTVTFVSAVEANCTLLILLR